MGMKIGWRMRMGSQAFVPGAGRLGVWLGRSWGDWASLFQSALGASSWDSQTPSSQEMSPVAFRASRLQDAQQDAPCGTSWPSGASSGVTSLPSARDRHPASLGSPRPCSAPLLPISEPDDSELSAGLPGSVPQEARAQSSVLDRHSQPPKVTWEDDFLTLTVPV